MAPNCYCPRDGQITQPSPNLGRRQRRRYVRWQRMTSTRSKSAPDQMPTHACAARCIAPSAGTRGPCTSVPTRGDSYDYYASVALRRHSLRTCRPPLPVGELHARWHGVLAPPAANVVPPAILKAPQSHGVPSFSGSLFRSRPRFGPGRAREPHRASEHLVTHLFDPEVSA